MGKESQSESKPVSLFGGVMFVPAGLFFGLGIGLLTDDKVVASTLLGVGLGFLGYGLSWILKRPDNQ